MQTMYLTVVGNVGGDPEQRTTNGGFTVTTFSVAVNHKRAGDEWTNWVRVSCFGKLGDTVMELANRGALGKGQLVVCVGRFAARPYTDRDGTERTSLDLDARDVILAGSRNDTSGGDTDSIPF